MWASQSTHASRAGAEAAEARRGRLAGGWHTPSTRKLHLHDEHRRAHVRPCPGRVSEGGGRPKEVARFPTCFKGIGAATEQLVRVARRRASWEDCTGWGFACAHATHRASEASDTPVPPTRTASTKSIPPRAQWEVALRPCGPAGVADAAASHTQVDLLLTDLSPNRTGMHDVDEARQTDMIEQALLLARRHLRDGGTFLTKVHELNRTEKQKVFNRAHL